MFEEDDNRWLRLQTDETPAQTRRIIAAMAQLQHGEGDDIDRVIRVHHTIQRLLPCALVWVPWSDRQAEMFNCDRVEGRVADFHSLRHTFITNLARSGVHPKAAQTLARHSTITLTMDRYSHTLIGEQAEAVKGLPDLTGPVVDERRKTGTDDRPGETHLACTLTFPKRKQSAKVDSGGLSVCGASGGVDGQEAPGNTAIRNKSKRKGRDSNPRTPFGVAGFQDRCNRPLCHPSETRSFFLSDHCSVHVVSLVPVTVFLSPERPVSGHSTNW